MKIGNAANKIINSFREKIRLHPKERYKETVACPIKPLNGLNALGVYRQASIKNQPQRYSWELDSDDKFLIKAKELLEEIRDEIEPNDYESMERPYKDDNYILDNRALSYIISNFCDTKSGNQRFKKDFLQAKVALKNLQLLDLEKREYFYKSKFISFIMNLFDDKTFKSSCVCLPNSFCTLDKMIDDDLVKVFTSDYFPKRMNIWTDINDIFPEYEKVIKSIDSLSKTKYGRQFKDLLITRKSEDIEELLNVLLPQVNNMSEEEFEKTHSILKKLLNAKTPDGDYVFGCSDNSDTTSKKFIDGIVNILDAADNNCEKFKQLMDLLELTEQGEIPPSVLGVLPKNGEINEEFLSQISKFKSGVQNVLSFDSFSEAAQKSETGDVVKIGERLFCKCDDALAALDFDEKIFKELFPPVQTLALEQGELGDCYLVAAIYDFIKNPKGRTIIYQMFEQKGDDIIVKIPDAKRFPIKYSNKKIVKDGRKNINAPIGIQMLEDAYRQTRSLKYNTADKMTMLEGGVQKNVYDAFIDKRRARCYKSNLEVPGKEVITEELFEISKELAELKKVNLKERQLSDDMSTVQSFTINKQQQNLNKIKRLESLQRSLTELLETIETNHGVGKESFRYWVLKFAKDKNNIISAGTKQGYVLDRNKLIYGSHAYSILSINEANKTVAVVNPWNTASFANLTFDEFFEYFDTFNVVKI